MSIPGCGDPSYESERVTVHHGDCLDVLRELDDNSVDAVVTDPPYGLEFMGREWDTFRVDDPGTTRHRGERSGMHGNADKGRGRGVFGRHGVAYGGGKRPTTFRCDSCGKRDQFRNTHGCTDTTWTRELIHEDGAPPTMLAFGEWSRQWSAECRRVLKPGGHMVAFGGTRTWHRLASAIEDAGFEIRDTLAWLYGSGFPKSLDVSKAIDKKVNMLHAPATPDAARWQGWGTALKPAYEPIVLARKPLSSTVAGNVLAWGTGALNVDGCRVGPPTLVSGRWPANVVLDGQAAAMLDDGASRFYYTAKADTTERPRANGVAHPTVKPLDLMRWLVRLVTPPGGTVLEPFAGSGTTVEACILEGFRCVAIERDADYLPLILQRIHRPLDPVAHHEATRTDDAEPSLFDLPG